MFTAEQVKSFNELEFGVYQYIIQHQAAVPYMRIRELAAETHVSTTTILRFCKKVDCNGYAEFKFRMRQYLGQKNPIQVPDDLDELQLSLKRFENATYQKLLDDAAGAIAKADHVLCAGICSSGYVAQHAARCFTYYGKFALSVTDPFYPVQQLDEKVNTIAVVFSVSGEAEKAVMLAKKLKNNGCRLICVSNTDQNTIARFSDITLPYFITHRRIWGDCGRGTEDIDYTSQVPAVAAVAELLAKRLASRLVEE